MLMCATSLRVVTRRRPLAEESREERRRTAMCRGLGWRLGGNIRGRCGGDHISVRPKVLVGSVWRELFGSAELLELGRRDEGPVAGVPDRRGALGDAVARWLQLLAAHRRSDGVPLLERLIARNRKDG